MGLLPDAVLDWLERPTPILRIEIARIFAPIAVLGFMRERMIHADEWIGETGFHVPDLGGDWRQPFYIPPVPNWLAWTIAGAMFLSGVFTCLGIKVRASALAFAATLVFVALSDRLETYTVTKLSPAIMIAVAFGPAGTRLTVEGYWKSKKTSVRPDKERASGAVRFLQLLALVFYSASGIAKVRGDWLKVPLVLWSHVHDSYQTSIAFALASILPGWSWTVLQGLVLVFELGAPFWLGYRRTRGWALLFGLGMHTMIGLMFGPVRWLSLLMMTLLTAGYLPEALIARLDRFAERFEPVGPDP